MAFVVSQGQLASLARPLVHSPGRLQLADDYTADYAQIWKKHSSVRTVAGFLGRNIASLGLHLFERVGDTDRRRNTDHPLAVLMGEPNPWTTRFRFLEALVQDLAVFDRFLAVKIRMQDGGAPNALVRVPPAWFSPQGGSWVRPDAFLVEGDKGRKAYTPDQVVYIAGYSPDGGMGGSSPIESLRAVLAEEFEATRMRAQAFRNGARVGGYIERPREASDWSREARDRFRKGWQAQYTGSGPNAYGTPILEDGMKFVPASQSAKDLQYIESRKLTREEAAAAYFIPPPMVGILDHATFSNIREQHKQLYQDTLGPWLQLIEQELMLQLLGDFDADGLYLEFNIAEKLRGSFEEQAQQMQAAVGGPYMSRNEARARMNLPAVEGGDELIVPLNVLTGGQASPQDSGSQNEGGQAAAPARPVKSRKGTEYEIKKPDEVPEDRQKALAKVFAKHFARQRAAVLSAAGAKAPDWWDADRWDGELAEDLLEASLGVSKAAALAVLKDMGEDPGAYSVERTRKFLKAVAERISRQVNAATLAALEAAAEDGGTEAMGHVFDVAEESRSDQSGMTAAATYVGFGMVEAARQTRPQARKRWQVNSGNPRSSHAGVNGEEVGIDDLFSNGLMWPGSFNGDVDEVANCQCSVVIIT